MPNFLYHYRNITALAAALVIGACAVAVMPAASADFRRTVAAAAAPRCVETQNPFLGSPS